MQELKMRQIVSGIAVALVILGFLAAGGLSQAVPAAAEEEAPTVPQDVPPAAGHQITYQGYLEKDGAPVNGNCDLDFLLYPSKTGPNASVGDTVLNTAVSNGQFSVLLDFGDGAFTGAGYWMEMQVRCPAGSGSWTALGGRTQMTAAPYALTLRPGAQIIDAADAGSVLTVASLAATGTSDALFAHVESKDAKAVSAISEASSGGMAVFGWAKASQGVSYGVYGQAEPNGWALYGAGNAYVVGDLHSGGEFNAQSNANFYGDVHVTGDLTWDAKTSYLSIPAAAFTPELWNDVGFIEYDNGGYFLLNQSSRAEKFTAPVQLPHGAAVKEVVAAFDDASDEESNLTLKRFPISNPSGFYDIMAEIVSVGSFAVPEVGTWADDTIDNAVVDNQNYIYFLEVTLPDNSEYILIYGVTIEYTTEGIH